MAGLNSERNKKRSEHSINQGFDGLETFQAKNTAPIALDFQLVDFLPVKSGKIDVVGRPQIERSSRKRKSTSLRPLLGLVFAYIMNRNECSVIGNNVIFKTFMNM